MKKFILILILGISFFSLHSQDKKFRPSKVDYDSYAQLVMEVKQHRLARLIDLDSFLKMSLDKDVVILDTRSDSMFERRHIKGSIHLNFSNFTESNLAKLLKSRNTKILIYCNNNIEGDEVYFPSKSSRAKNKNEKDLMLALNVPTYISLYGYGYKNVFELSELVNINDTRVEFEGTAEIDKQLIKKLNIKK